MISSAHIEDSSPPLVLDGLGSLRVSRLRSRSVARSKYAPCSVVMYKTSFSCDNSARLLPETFRILGSEWAGSVAWRRGILRATSLEIDPRDDDERRRLAGMEAIVPEISCMV